MARVKQEHISLAQRLGISVDKPAPAAPAAPKEEKPVKSKQWSKVYPESGTRFGPQERPTRIIESGNGKVRAANRNLHGDIEIQKGERVAAEPHGRKFKFDKSSESHKHFLLNSKGAKIHPKGFMSLPKSDMVSLKKMEAENKAGITKVPTPKMASSAPKKYVSPAEKEKMRQAAIARTNAILKARKGK